MTAARLSSCAMASAALALSGCSPQIVLGDADNLACIDTGCGSMTQSGAGGRGGSLGDPQPQAGSSPTSLAGQGGSVSSGGGESGAGGLGQAGGGQAGAPACQPAAVDQSCDGLDEACQPTSRDQGCSASCNGLYDRGTSYMSCFAGDDFDQAEARCQANGMHLAKIDSALENATVLSLAQDEYVWVGGSNRADLAVFVWLDGTAFYASGAAVGDTYENFDPIEPSADRRLRCLQLRRSTSGTWSNAPCSDMQSFVCERY